MDKKRRAIRNLQCSDIDFVGRQKQNRKKDAAIAKAVIKVVADPEKVPENWDGAITSYCKQRQWLKDEYQKAPCSCSNSIPLFDMVVSRNRPRKQYVIGRMTNLKDYYTCQDYFYTLDSNDWDSLYQINDLFIYCSQGSRENDFPIRIVTHPKRGIKNKDPDVGIAQYNLLTIPHLMNQSSSIHISSRELCQIASYFKMSIYQSQDHPHIFFATHKSSSQLSSKIKRFKLKQVTLK